MILAKQTKNLMPGLQALELHRGVATTPERVDPQPLLQPAAPCRQQWSIDQFHAGQVRAVRYSPSNGAEACLGFARYL